MQQFENIGTEEWVDLVALGLTVPAVLTNMGHCECRVSDGATKPTEANAGTPVQVFGERQGTISIAGGTAAVWVRFTLVPGTIHAT